MTAEPKPHIICEIVRWAPGVDEADANLIAAAPELLEVAKLILIFNKGNPHPEDEDSWAWFARGIVDKATAAIAKAEGSDV